MYALYIQDCCLKFNIRTTPLSNCKRAFLMCSSINTRTNTKFTLLFVSVLEVNNTGILGTKTPF